MFAEISRMKFTDNLRKVPSEVLEHLDNKEKKNP